MKSHMFCSYWPLRVTSSTAEGGGRNFKNKKHMPGRAHPLMDRNVVGVVIFGVIAMVAVVTSPTAAGCSVL